MFVFIDLCNKYLLNLDFRQIGDIIMNKKEKILDFMELKFLWKDIDDT